MKITCLIYLAFIGFVHAAGLDFPAPLQEIRATADVKSVTAEFPFTNRSDKPVNVTKYDPSCSCIAVEIQNGKLRYAPGESGLLRAQFNMGNFSGTVDKVVALWLDADPPDKPSVALTVRVHIPVLISLEPKTLKWDLNGSAGPQSIRITMNDAKPIRVTKVDCSSDVFKHELKTVEDGKKYDLIITPRDVKTAGLAIFRIETDCSIEKYRTQQAFATTRKPPASSSSAKP